MRIVVCLKQVPDTSEVKIDPVKGTLIREGVPSIINPDDRHALEEALRLRETEGGEVIVISMGPPQAETALREALALGAERAILVTDRMFAGADTFATANALEAAVKRVENVDLVFCGQQAIDGDTAQVGPQLAERLELPQITYAVRLWIEGDKLVAVRGTEEGEEELQVPLPTLVTATKELNVPRYPSINGIVNLKDKTIERWTGTELKLDPNKVGLAGSKTKVKKTFAPQAKGQSEIIQGADPEVVARILSKIAERV